MTTPAETRADVERDAEDTYEFSTRSASDPTAPGLWIYLLAGTVFGIVLTKGEAISWFRIQEMFRFQGFHMFGIFATALPTAIVGVQLLKRRWRRTLGGEAIVDSAEAPRLGGALRRGGHDLRARLGAHRRVPRPAVRTARQRRDDDGRRDRERDARHMDLRSPAPPPAALITHTRHSPPHA